MEGTVIGGRYRIEALLGAGATSRVYRAVDEATGRPVAVKILHLGPGQHREKHRARFGSEAEVMRTLNHPNILSIEAVGSDEDCDYIVTELCLESLHLMQQRIGPLPMRQAVHYTLQLLAGLAAAHHGEVVHRDIKPDNLLVSMDGTIKISDFGIARQLRAEHGRTHAGLALGSLSYMAPEQRLDAASVGPAADLYAAGVTFYALLTCSNPTDLFLATMESPRWEGVPEVLIPVIRKATSVTASDRYASAQEMSIAIMACVPYGSPPVVEVPNERTEEYVATAEFESRPEQGRVRRDEHGALILGSERWSPTGIRPLQRKAKYGALWISGALILSTIVVGSAAWVGTQLSPTVTETAPVPAADMGRAVEIEEEMSYLGIWNEEGVMSLTLHVTENSVSGSSTVRIGQVRQSALLRGTLDPDTMWMILTDRPESNDYLLQFDGRMLRGEVTSRESGRTVPVALVRSH